MNLDVPTIKVKKRGKRDDEILNIEKIHEMVSYATEDLKGVSASQVEMSSGLQFYDGMTTEEIQQILIKSSADLISPFLTPASPCIPRPISISLSSRIKLGFKVWGREQGPKATPIDKVLSLAFSAKRHTSLISNPLSAAAPAILKT